MNYVHWAYWETLLFWIPVVKRKKEQNSNFVDSVLHESTVRPQSFARTFCHGSLLRCLTFRWRWWRWWWWCFVWQASQRSRTYQRRCQWSPTSTHTTCCTAAESKPRPATLRARGWVLGVCFLKYFKKKLGRVFYFLQVFLLCYLQVFVLFPLFSFC